jgi:hypothetical protein
MPQQTLASPVPLPPQKPQTDGSFAVASVPPLAVPISRAGATAAAPAPAVERPETSFNALRVPVFSPEQQQRMARSGLHGPARSLPFLPQIQRSFGPYDVRGVETFAGVEARQAAAGLDARAYTTEGSIVFAEQLDLYMAAHEAAHGVQLRSHLLNH